MRQMISAVKRLGGGKLLPAIVGALLMSAAGGVAWAAIPDSGGAIHGCYQKNVGTLRVVDTTSTASNPNTSSCRNDEQPLTWSQTGPQGPQGPQGVKGDKGDTGDRGPSDAYATQNPIDFLPLTATNPATQQVAHLDLPAGSYVLEATLWASNPGGEVASFYCDLRASSRTTENFSNVPKSPGPGDAGRITFGVENADTYAAAGSADLNCSTWRGGDIVLHQVQLIATQVGTVHRQ